MTNENKTKPKISDHKWAIRTSAKSFPQPDYSFVFTGEIRGLIQNEKK
jgi:hypothetical protein